MTELDPLAADVLDSLAWFDRHGAHAGRRRRVLVVRNIYGQLLGRCDLCSLFVGIGVYRGPGSVASDRDSSAPGAEDRGAASRGTGP